ncbi:MAG: SURF1 family cytochrome oxidase biogenesis protein, partial [Acidimicrobiia bacterium]|nr:SURF1 family cytochrome oxidase biogenesis protein [Acidimicrobiia bacterium]
MLDLLRTPRWAIATAVVALVCTVFVALGGWQLQRHEERRIQNAVQEQRLSAAPLPLDDMLA